MADQANKIVDQIIQAQAANQLRSYRGNLEFANHVIRNGWLPAEDEPGVQQHLAILQEHLAAIGCPEDDSFLLRLGLTVPGWQRGIKPPIMVLDANRGGFSKRRQGQAEGQIVRLREALAIGRRFVVDLSSSPQQAIAELAEWCQRQGAPSDIVWLGWFNDLSADGVDQLAERAIEFLASDTPAINEIGTDILQGLACLRQSALGEGWRQALVERNVFNPPCLYRDSGDAIARQLISRIDTPSEMLAHDNLLLLALAWTRSGAAHEAFRHWSERRPAWASKWHVPPEQYLPSAGWTLTEDGERRELISTRCYRLAISDETGSRSIRCRVRIDDDCPSCGGPLRLLFDFSRLAAEFFPGEFADAPRRVLCCLNCARYEPGFTSYRGGGNGEWLSPVEPREAGSFDDVESGLRMLVESPFPPFACAEPFVLGDASTLGGVPMWLQDDGYPSCLECGRLMTFLAQHDNSPLGEEGIYYAFFCAVPRCGRKLSADLK